MTSEEHIGIPLLWEPTLELRWLKNSDGGFLLQQKWKAWRDDTNTYAFEWRSIKVEKEEE